MVNTSASRILLVDDEPSLLRMMAAYLSRLGYPVVTFTSTDKAWARAQEEPAGFALAVLDMSMPGLSTEELALNLLGADPAIRVVASSGYPVDLEHLEKAAPGRVTFLHKPFTPEMLAGAVRRMLPE